jgi:GntR family transcriptional regulator, transcriptional repressor for pyruvate dehydrogenase complex
MKEGNMFKSVRPDRISQVIVDQIKETIFQKKIKIGDKLPSERQMMEQFQTSRVSVREALKILENSGILEIKRGTQGGAFVRDPDVKFVNNFLRDMFSMGNIKVFDLTEARLAIEPYAVKIAAERIREDSLDLIKQNIRETWECLKSNNQTDARLLTLEFHRLIAQASENPVIFFVVDSIMDIMENNVSTIYISAKSVKSTIHYHEEIYEAILRRNSEAARELMLKHIQEIQSALECRT